MAKKRTVDESAGQVSVREAGRRGGVATSERHGKAFYEQIGAKGGKRVQELLAAGRRAEGEREGEGDG